MKPVSGCPRQLLVVVVEKSTSRMLTLIFVFFVFSLLSAHSYIKTAIKKKKNSASFTLYSMSPVINGIRIS